MRNFVASLILLLPQVLLAKQTQLHSFFLNLSKLEFERAQQAVKLEADSTLRVEMRQLADILYFEGQAGKTRFAINQDINDSETDKAILVIIRELEAGYISLFYDQVKGDAFRHFYKAYQLAKANGDPDLLKACLLALLKYYNTEIAQNSDAYQPYIEHFKRLQSDTIDLIWATTYRIIFYAKALKLDSSNYYNYCKLFETLDELKKNVDTNSPVLAYISIANAHKLDSQNKPEDAKKYYLKTIAFSKDYPFLRRLRFFSYIKLMMIASGASHFDEAQHNFGKARTEIDKADTLRSNYHLNLYYSFLLNAQHKDDSAYIMLKKAYAQDFQLDFRRNTLEVNRLNVELETQEKENANLQLKQNRIWLISALAGVGSLLLVSYLGYTNQRSKNRMQAKEKEVQAMKLEKVLKDQEIFGIDAMIEGQEKERQRMAGDLHDNLGSLLAALKLHFHSLKSKKYFIESDPDKLLQKTDDLLEETYQKVRGMAHAGNAGVNAQEGLLPAVKNFVSKVSILNSLVIDVEEHGMNSRLENTLEITIFRIIQELITNIIKHAQASEVVIHLTHYEDAINLMVEDNGIGFDISQVKPSGGMGLHSIQKKIENLGGRVTIDSVVQKGTTVIIDVPLT
jgi:two-component system, NarL family, sensor histidine kinase DegS